MIDSIKYGRGRADREHREKGYPWGLPLQIQMMKKQKLELTWIGKENRPKLEPRILIEDPEKSYHAAHRVSEKDIFDNRLIFGDNLLALKALEQEFTGKIKCIFIDPPYNTGSAFEYYDDGIEHSLWLTLIRDRLELLRALLTESGTIWISIDDRECHYLKILCDEIYGRSNFTANVIWQKRTSPDIRATLGAGHDHILVFAKNLEEFKKVINKIPKSQEQRSQFKNPDNDPRGPWVSSDYTAQGFRPNQMYKILTPGGAEYYPPARHLLEEYRTDLQTTCCRWENLVWPKQQGYTPQEDVFI